MTQDNNGNSPTSQPTQLPSESCLPSKVQTVKTTDLVGLRETLVQVWRSVESLRATVTQQQTELNQLKTAIEDRQEGWAAALNKTNETTLAALQLVQVQQDKQTELMQFCQEQFEDLDQGLSHADAHAQACRISIHYLSHRCLEVIAPEVLPSLQEFEAKVNEKLKEFELKAADDKVREG